MRKNKLKDLFVFSELRSTQNGLASFSKTDRILIRLYIAYIFIVPVLSVLAYEYFVERYHPEIGYHLEETHNSLIVVFFLPICMHTVFILNNLKVGNSFNILFLMLRVPIELVICHFIFGWNILYSFSMVYVVEIFAFITGLVFGTIFRKAPITITHRLISFIIAAVLLVLVYFRFYNCFDIYLDSKIGNLYEYSTAILGLAIAAMPYIRIFIHGDITETSKFFEKIVSYLVLSILLNILIIPFIIIYFIK
jgi:hypothetical protein